MSATQLAAEEIRSVFYAYVEVTGTGDPVAFKFQGRRVVLHDYRDPAWRQLPEWGGNRD